MQAVPLVDSRGDPDEKVCVNARGRPCPTTAAHRAHAWPQIWAVRFPIAYGLPEPGLPSDGLAAWSEYCSRGSEGRRRVESSQPMSVAAGASPM